MEHLSTILLTAAKIKQATERNPTLSKVKHYTLLGWLATPGIYEADLKPYLNRRNELSLEDNVLSWGNCVVIPFCFQPSHRCTSLHLHRNFTDEKLGLAVCVVA